MFKRTGFQILHVILGFIIVLNILDFFEVLNPFWDYVKKVVSWFLVGLLFYRLSPSTVILGVRHRMMDFWYVIAAFALTINDMLQYAEVMRQTMIAQATKYVTYVQESGPVVGVVHVTEGVWNSLSFGIPPDIMQYGLEYVTQLTMNNPVVHVAMSYAGEQVTLGLVPLGLSGSMLTVYNSLFPYFNNIQMWGLISGMILLVAWSLFSLRVPVAAKSILGLIDSGPISHIGRGLVRFFLVFAVSTFFFLFVFSLVMEWLAIAIDAPILMVAILASLFLMLVRHQHFSLNNWEEWVLHVGAEYVEPFMKLFMHRRTVLLGISGLLVLHVLTEVMNYLLPFILPMRDQLYLAQLGVGHENLIFSIFPAGLTGVLLHDVSFAIVIIANILAWFGLLSLPGYIWYKVYKLRSDDHPKHHPRFSPFVLGVFSASLMIMLLAPVIWFRQLSEGALIGVDFYTQALNSSPVIPVFIGIIVFVVVFFLAQFSFRRFLYIIPLLSSLLFLAAYSYLFFMSSVQYYLLAGLNSLALGNSIIGVTFLLFLLYSAIFYSSGFLLFTYEIIRD